jgi:hypothetical protein
MGGAVTVANAGVDLPRIHVARIDAHGDPHVEVDQRGFASLLAPDAAFPRLNIDGSPEQLRDPVLRPQAALVSQR